MQFFEKDMISGQKYKLYLAAIHWEYFRPIGSFGSKLGPKEHDMTVSKDHSPPQCAQAWKKLFFDVSI